MSTGKGGVHGVADAEKGGGHGVAAVRADTEKGGGHGVAAGADKRATTTSTTDPTWTATEELYMKEDSLNVKNAMKSTEMKMALWDMWDLHMKEDLLNVKNALKSTETKMAVWDM